MTLGRACEPISQPRRVSGGDHRYALWLLLDEVQQAHGQDALAGLVRDLDPEPVGGRKPGTEFTTVGRRHDRGAHRVCPNHLIHHQL